MTSSVDGLISGLDTSALISKLMQAEAGPQKTLQAKVTAKQTVIGAYQSINTKLAAAQTAAHALTLADTWQTGKATSSSPSLVVTAIAGATSGDYTVDVTALAKAHTLTSVVGSGTAVTGGAGIDITVGAGSPVHIDVTPTTDTAEGLAAAINLKGAGVRASVVTTDAGKVLQLTATKTGGAATFTATGLTAPTNVAVAGSDAQAKVTSLAGAYNVTSASNTFTGVLTGVTFTATAVQTGTTIALTGDTSGLADKMQAMVDAVNAGLTEIRGQTAFNAASSKSSALTGDFTARQVQQNLLGAVSTGQTGFGSFSKLGVQLDISGKLIFNRDTFTAAYSADPNVVQTAVSTGLAAQLDTVTKNASDKTTGTVTSMIQGANQLVEDLNTQIASWTIRLASRQTALQKQFSTLEVALGKMKQQSNWLSGQLASMSANNG